MRVDAHTYAIVRLMIERGNKPGVIRHWMTQLAQWADANTGSDAAALRSWLSMARPKPFYSAEELAVMWPALKIACGLEKRLYAAPSPKLLAIKLEVAGLPYLTGGKSFVLPFLGPRKMFIVERIAYWRQRMPDQEEFENALNQ